MSRTVITQKDLPDHFIGGGTPQPATPVGRALRPDSYVEGLLKLVPAEIVAVWVTIRSVMDSANHTPSWLPWVAFAILIVLTPFYMQRVAKVSKNKQIVITTVALLVWAYSLGGIPFATLASPWYEPIYAAVLLPLYTFAVPITMIDR